MTGWLRLSALEHVTGRGVRVAIIDSGVNAAHPHVQGVAGGVSIDAAGHELSDFVDRLGHGTAVTAVIREKAPGAEIYAVKVFDRELAATADALAAAIEWAIRAEVCLVNLSLGTTNPAHEPSLARVVAKARDAGISVVAAAPQPDARWLPGALAGTVGVEVDWALARDVCRVTLSNDDIRIAASGYPRPIPGVPPERNLRGLSFAVANATGVLARVVAAMPSDLPRRSSRSAGQVPARAKAGYLAAAISGVLETESGTEPSS